MERLTAPRIDRYDDFVAECDRHWARYLHVVARTLRDLTPELIRTASPHRDGFVKLAVGPADAVAEGQVRLHFWLPGRAPGKQPHSHPWQPTEINTIETVVLEAETGRRDAAISVEAQALSDADTLFKSLPITPVVLAPRYLAETGRSLRELAGGIVRDQVPLDASGIYFYSAGARHRYAAWGTTNLQLWQYILDSLDDPDVAHLLELIEDDRPTVRGFPPAAG